MAHISSTIDIQCYALRNNLCDFATASVRMPHLLYQHVLSHDKNNYVFPTNLLQQLWLSYNNTCVDS